MITSEKPNNIKNISTEHNYYIKTNVFKNNNFNDNINIIISIIKTTFGIVSSAKMNYIFIEHKNEGGGIVKIKYGNNKHQCITYGNIETCLLKKSLY